MTDGWGDLVLLEKFGPCVYTVLDVAKDRSSDREVFELRRTSSEASYR